MQFIGIDGCKSGWFYVQIDADKHWKTGVVDNISDLETSLQQSTLSLIDIPIGLRGRDTTERHCDTLARQALKPERHASVFPVPSRLCMSAQDYQQASALNQQATGRKLSKQSWFITAKIKQVDTFLYEFQERDKLREMHPELCFWALNDFQAMQYNKKTDSGFKERTQLLMRFFPESNELIRQALNSYPRHAVARDDIVDALVGALTAAFYPRLQSLPAQPEIDEQGLPMEVVYAIAPQNKKHNINVDTAVSDSAIVATPAGKLMLKSSNERLFSSIWVPEVVAEKQGSTHFLQNIANQVSQYWLNPGIEFRFKKQQQGSAFSNKVWQEISKIPVGQTRTYGELAKALATGPRAIGNACRNNPLPLFVPCHRVVSASGMGGYDGQTNGKKMHIKQSLLTHEAKFRS